MAACDNEAYELLLIEEADAWFEYLEATRGQTETIGLENPYDSSSVIGAMKLENASLCASATNRRAWGDWHHVIDPRTAKPVSEVVATWVSAAMTLEADGLATALFFVGPEALKKWSFHYVRLIICNI